jgi:hypothetical protein
MVVICKQLEYDVGCFRLDRITQQYIFVTMQSFSRAVAWLPTTEPATQDNQLAGNATGEMGGV